MVFRFVEMLQAVQALARWRPVEPPQVLRAWPCRLPTRWLGLAQRLVRAFPSRIAVFGVALALALALFAVWRRPWVL